MRAEGRFRENLVSDGVTVSESDSQTKENDTQERVSESASEVRVNSHQNESESQERVSESVSEVRVNEYDVQASELTMNEIYVTVREKSGVTEIQESAMVTL